MASITSTLASLYKRLFSTTEVPAPKITLRQRHTAMARAARRTRKTHAFHFLDLPAEIRSRIYVYLFCQNITQVCSYNKDKTSDAFSKDERCQILLTCRSIYNEAWQMYYYLSDWKFTKVSSLDYIAWGDDGGLQKLQFVQHVIITNQAVVAVFQKYLHFFPNLKTLVIDFSTRMNLKYPLKRDEYSKTAKKIKNGEWWNDRVGPYLPLQHQRSFSIKIGILLSFADRHIKPEIILVDVDRLTIARNFRPVDPPQQWGCIHMPSSEDADAELSWIDANDVDKRIFAPVPKSRGKRKLQAVSN